MLTDILDQILNAPAPWVLAVVGAVVFAEDALFVGFVLPGKTAAILGGVAANRGHVPLPLMIAVVILAAVIGDSVGFEVGRHLGPPVMAVRILQRHQSRLDDARAFLTRRGGWAVLLGRWIAFFRAVMPALAGTSDMRYRTFLTFNVTGGAIWGIAVVVAGYLAGASYTAVEQALGKGAALIALGAVLIGLAVWHLRRRQRHNRAHQNLGKSDHGRHTG